MFHINLKKMMITSTVILLTFTHISFGQTKAEEVDKLINLYHEYGKFNGSALVAEEGKIVYQQGVGMANMEWEIENMTDTEHRLGSITKQFTAMLIL